MRAKDGLGRYGEDVAARYLVDAGLVLLARNWRCAEGEIDIVARDGDVLVICEVKTRRDTTHGTPVEAVTARKAERLKVLAQRWLAAHSARPRAVRFDVVSVLAAGRGAASVDHRVAVI